MKKSLHIGFFLVALMILGDLQAQETGEQPDESQFGDAKTGLWINTYGNMQISDRLFWVAQTHFRFQNTNTPFIGQIAQIYNRHAIGYLHNKNFNLAAGFVLRINFNTSQQPPDRRAVPEWRLWHEYNFAQSFSPYMVYHRIRIEHRWTRGFKEDSEWIFRNRWRYMFKFKMPLGKPKLGPQTYYFSPEVELIMQSGKAVVDSPFEDLRLHGSFGYIVNPRITVASGLMYSFGQDLVDGAYYNQKWTIRCHLYFSPDLRKVKNKIPSIHFDD